MSTRLPRRTRVGAFAVAVVAVVLLPGCGGAPVADPTSAASTSSPGAVDPTTAPPEVPALHPSVDQYPAAELVITRDSEELARVAVRVADTSDRHAHGLMEVPHVPAGVGMWFAYQEDHRSSFWMENTLVPLDIAFVAADGTILQILTMEPCKVVDCPTYEPAQTYRNALEVPAGWFTDVGVGIGDHVRRR